MLPEMTDVPPFGRVVVLSDRVFPAVLLTIEGDVVLCDIDVTRMPPFGTELVLTDIPDSALLPLTGIVET